MSKKQILLLLLVFLLGLGLAKMVAAQSQIDGPDQTQTGTLTTFEIIPLQDADWTVTSTEATDKIYQTDTSTNRMYFATPQAGTYHIIAAIVVEGKPQVLTKTFINGNGDKIQPPPPNPDPPAPPTHLAEWVRTQGQLLAKSSNVAAERLLVADCFSQTIAKIENGAIKSAQNARTQLQIALTMSLAFASETAIDDWQPFLTELSKQMAKELGDKVNDINAVKTVFQTVADAVKSVEFGVGSVELKEKQSKTPVQCEKCDTTMPPTPNSTFLTPHYRQFRLFR